MLLQFFKKQRLNWQLYLLGYALALKAIWVFAAVQKSPEVLQNSWLESFLPQPVSVIVSVLLALGLLFFCALLVNGIVNRHGIIYTGTNLPGMSFILISALAVPLQGLGKFSILVLLSLLIYNKLFKASQKEVIEPNVFDISFLIGLGSLWYFQFGLFFPALLATLPFINIPRLRYFGLAFFGFSLPWYGWAVYKFLTNDLTWFVSWWEMVKSQFLRIPEQLDVLQELGAGLLVFMFIICLTAYLVRLNRIPAPVKPFLISLLIAAAFGVVYLVLFPGQRWYITALIVVPLSISLGHTFYYIPKLLASVLHWLLIAGAIVLPVLIIFNV